MRQRSLTQRIITALFGLWFSLLVAEPVPLHACPMHDGTLVQAAVTHAPLLTDVVDGVRAEHVGVHASPSHVHPVPDRSSEHGAHHCQCLGCCAGASALSLPDVPDGNLRGTIALTQAKLDCGGAVLQDATRFAFALPFANGPPETVPPAV